MRLYVRIKGEEETAVFESDHPNFSMAQVEVALALAQEGCMEWGPILAVIEGGKK